MSKMDGLRAMREARYEEGVARARAGAAPKATGRLAAGPAKAPVTAAAPEGEASEAPLCGHKAISGRTCTREQGHAAKSHRYS